VLGIWPKFPSASPVPPGGGGEGSLSTVAGWCSAYIPPWQGSRAAIDPRLPCQAQVRLLLLLGAHGLFGRVGVSGLGFQVLLQLARNRAIGTGRGTIGTGRGTIGTGRGAIGTGRGRYRNGERSYRHGERSYRHGERVL
jgi:hypothetical protein